MAFTGTGCKVAIGANVIAEQGDYSLDLGKAFEEITNKDSLNWEEVLPTIKNWKGSLDCNLKMADTTGQKALWDAYLADTLLTLKFPLQGTQYMQGTAYVESMPIKVPAKGKVSVTFNFRGTAAITYAAV